jgi:hypothetical protein
MREEDVLEIGGKRKDVVNTMGKVERVLLLTEFTKKSNNY